MSFFARSCSLQLSLQFRNKTKRMKKLLLVSLIMLSVVSCKKEIQGITTPSPKKEMTYLVTHGDSLPDAYEWMELTDEEKNDSLSNQKTKAVRNLISEENAYTAKVMAPYTNLQNKLFEEMKGRQEQKIQSVPYNKNDYEYSVAYEEGDEYPRYYRKKLTEGAEKELLLDGPEMAKGHDYIDIAFGPNYDVTENEKMMAYAVDTLSRRSYTIYFKNLETGEILDEKLDSVTTNFVWANDSKTLFYITRDPQTLRWNKVKKHVLGTNPEYDELIYEEKDEEFGTSINITKSRKFLLISNYSRNADEYYFLNADDPNGKWKLFQGRQPDMEYNINHIGDYFYIHTNWGAPNFKLMRTTLDKTENSHWEDFLVPGDGIKLDNVHAFKNHLVISERFKGLQQIRVVDAITTESSYLKFKDPTYSMSLSSRIEFNAGFFRYYYESMTTPYSVYDYHFDTKKSSLRKTSKVMDVDFKSANYISERFFVKGRDGTEIPVSLVYKKNRDPKNSGPLLLYGYGSYGSNLDPWFSTSRLSLLDRGFVFAIAHVRGSELMGRSWYENGKFLNKKNTFFDFIDVAKHLIDEGYTQPKHLYAEGGSAGGLLMGAVANMAPELWNGIIAQVPFVDVMNTMLNEDLPLTVGEYEEWGNPNDKTYYDYMKSYSPYDNVARKAYPSMLVTTGFWDSQVQYWEPLKWVSKLRDYKTDDNHILLKCNLVAGHGGSSGRFESLKEQALEYAFLLMLEGKGE